MIYSDYAATAPLCRPALDAMLPWLESGYGNPSGMYAVARDAKKCIQNARVRMAALLGVEPECLYFTSGGTESDNWALKSAMERQKAARRDHLVISAIEHHAVLYTADYLEKQGAALTRLPVDSTGQIQPDALEKALRPATALVSIMAANNEIGSILPAADCAAAVKAYDKQILFHCDAVQAIGHIPFTITPQMDMVSLSAHKFGGPKGVGALYIRKGLPLPPLLHGGGHERGRRSSTENVAGIAGMAAALEYAISRMDDENRRLTALRETLINGVLNAVPYSHLTGSRESRLPGNASFVFESIEGESLVLALDRKGVAASSGSACSSASLDPSHVLLAIGLPHEIAHGSLRLSIGEGTAESDIPPLIAAVEEAVAQMRTMSPLWKNGKPTERFWG